MEKENNLPEEKCIKASTVYDYETTRELYRFSIYKSKNPKIFLVLFNVCALIVVALFIVNFSIFSYDYSILVCMLIMIFCIALFNFMWFLMHKVNFEKRKLAKNAKNEYIFNEDDFEMSSNSIESSSSSKIKYSQIYKIYETKDYFYLFLDKASAAIVEKSGIENASAEDLRNLFESNLSKDKFKILM